MSIPRAKGGSGANSRMTRLLIDPAQGGNLYSLVDKAPNAPRPERVHDIESRAERLPVLLWERLYVVSQAEA